MGPWDITIDGEEDNADCTQWDRALSGMSKEQGAGSPWPWSLVLAVVSSPSFSLSGHVAASSHPYFSPFVNPRWQCSALTVYKSRAPNRLLPIPIPLPNTSTCLLLLLPNLSHLFGVSFASQCSATSLPPRSAPPAPRPARPPRSLPAAR